MKFQKASHHISILSLWLMALGVLGLTITPNSRAGLTGPYTNDFYTLHLWHLQDTNGTIAGVATNGVYFYDSQSNNALVVPLLISNTPGPSLIGSTAAFTDYDLAGQPGPGTGPLFQQLETNYGYAFSVQNTQWTGLFAPWDNNGSDYPDPSYALTNDSCSFVNTNTGAFTWEALIQPGFNPLTYTADQLPIILCSDGPNTTPPGSNPYSVRSVQLRFKNATPSSGGAQLEFNGNISTPANYLHDVFAALPTTGPDAIAQGTWYHVAVAFTGTAPTNGDPPNVLTLYWTKFDPTRTNADVLATFTGFFTFTNTTHTSLSYPSNSIVGTGVFAIGQEPRLSNGQVSGGWVGNVAEVRISDCCRHPNEFMFNTNAVGLPPAAVLQPTNSFVGYGQSLALSLQVSGSQPYFYQWYQSGLPLSGQTNSSLILSNITYAADSATWYAIVTNSVGSGTSAVATVTVGANFDGLFNTGCGANYQPLDKTAPGFADPHWQLTSVPSGSAATVPNAIVWSDGSPLQPNGLVPPNGASVWIGPHENNDNVSGSYTYQTTFQVDETAVTSTNGISGTVDASGGSGGATLQMFLNGAETDITLSGNPSETIVPLSIVNGLQAGSNTLVCTVSQSGSFDDGFNLDVLSDIGPNLTTAPAINNQPASTTNLFGSTVSFQAVALGAPPLMYYWLSNGVAITPPTWVYTAPAYLSFVATNFSTAELTGTDFIANYQVVFTNFMGSVTSSVATLDVQIPPLGVTSAGVPVWNSTNNRTNIVVYFSGAVDPVTAAMAGNYLLNNGASVLSAALGSAPGEVVLTTTVLNPATSYTLTVQNVNSAFGLAMSPSPVSLSVGTYPAFALWLKAGTGTVSDGSGGVGQWNDQSGNGNNFMSAYGPGFDPVLATNTSGYPVVRFNGANDDTLYANNATSLRLTNDMTVFAVVNFATLNGGTNGEIVSETDQNNIPAPYDYYANATSARLLRGNGSGTPGAVASTQVPSTNVTHILDVVMQGSQVTHRLDGLPNGTGTISTAISDAGQPIQIGSREDSGNHLTGDLNELIMLGSALPANEVASMESYLAGEYNLPIGPQININATNIVFSVTNNQMVLSWPADHIGWTLQSQTNVLSAGLSTNWVNVTGSLSTNQVAIPINLTNGSVFYRLILP